MFGRYAAHLYLLIFGTSLGALLAGVTFLLFRTEILAVLLPPSQRFESIDDLRRAMLTRNQEEDNTATGVSLRTLIQPHPSDEIIYELKPNLAVRFQSVDVTTNALGMRDSATTVEKHPGVFRIAILGDSYAFGWGVAQGESFPDHLERELQRTAPAGRTIEVLNFGTPGYSTFQEVAQFQAKGLAFQPDVVVVYFIHNDFALPFFIRDLVAPDSTTLATAFDFRQMKFADMNAENQTRRGKLLAALDANRALLSLAKLCEAAGIVPFLTVHPDERESGVWSKLWVLKNAPGKDLLQAFSLRKGYEKLLASGAVSEQSLTLPNDAHPGAGSHKYIGSALAEELRQRIAELSFGIGRSD